MGLEIERKFLINPNALPELGFGVMTQQGYISRDPTVRVRIQERDDGPVGYLTIKGKGTLTRAEYEYEVPVNDAREMLKTLCAYRLEKVRYKVSYGDHTWEIDRFAGLLSGLWLAEIELATPNERFDLPRWVTNEVTDDVRYTNVVLAERGYPL